MFKPVISQRHVWGLALSLALLIAVALFSYLGWREYQVFADQTKNINTLVYHLKDLLSDVARAEASQRGFMLTRDPSYRIRYTAAIGAVREHLSVLNAADSPEVTDRELFDRLRSAVLTELDELDRMMEPPSVSRAKSDTPVPAPSAVTENRIYEIEKQAEALERNRLVSSRTLSRRYARLSQLIATLGCAGIFAVVLFSSSQIQSLLTTRSRLNEELSRSSEELRNLADSVPQMVWRTTETGVIEYVNQRWRDFTSASLVGSSETWRVLLHPEDREPFLGVWTEAMKTRNAFAAECRLKDVIRGRYHWFLFRATPSIDGSSAVQHWYGTYTDIDHQKNAEKALERANEELRQFAYVAAHDLQEPLRNISNLLGLIRHAKLDRLDQASVGFLDESIANARRMHKMVTDLLAYSTVVDRSGSLQEASDANECVATALSNLKTAIDETGAEVHCGFLPTLKIRSNHLVQLFQNVIGNSLKYRRDAVAPQITINAFRNPGEWVFTIRDNGIGFDPAYADRIFGVFKRLHRADEYTGTGIGLAICARIVDHYGGRIWANGKPEQGATFHFSIPTESEN
jgi:PAS domain S-box-containing protein